MAICSGTSPLKQLAFRPIRTLMPRIRSGLAIATSAQTLGSSRRKSQLSPTADTVREAVDTGKADVQVGQDPGLGRPDDMLAKALEIAGTGTADIDPGRGATTFGEPVRADAQGRPTPIDMGIGSRSCPA